LELEAIAEEGTRFQTRIWCNRKKKGTPGRLVPGNGNKVLTLTKVSAREGDQLLLLSQQKKYFLEN